MFVCNVYVYKDQESYVLDTSQWTDNQNNEDIKLSLNPWFSVVYTLLFSPEIIHKAKL